MKINREIKKQAVRDFYGRYTSNLKVLKQYLIRRNNRPKLTEEQKNDLWCIKTNLADKAYRESMELESASNSL